MYLIPIAAIVLLALIAVAWSPAFALVLFAIGFVAFLVYVGLNRRADERMAPAERPGPQPRHEDEAPTGLWGERRPS